MDGVRGIDLKVMRVRAGLKQYEVAQRLGIPPPALSGYENDRKPLSPDRAAAISEAIRELAEREATKVGDERAV